MFLFHSGAELAESRHLSEAERIGQRRPRRATPTLERPLVLLVTTKDVVGELRSTAGTLFRYGDGPVDAETGIDVPLQDAIRLAAHPVDLVRRLGDWADRAQAAVPPGRIVACWHPAVSAEVLRQASRYPVHVINATKADDALAAAGRLLAELPVAGVA